MKKPTNTTTKTPPPDVIDPNAPVDFDQFTGDVGDDDDVDDVDGDHDDQQPLDEQPPVIEKPVAAAPRRTPTDVALRVAAEIANEAKRKHPQTVEQLIAFHDFVLARVKDAQEA